MIVAVAWLVSAATAALTKNEQPKKRSHELPRSVTTGVSGGDLAHIPDFIPVIYCCVIYVFFVSFMIFVCFQSLTNRYNCYTALHKNETVSQVIWTSINSNCTKITPAYHAKIVIRCM